MVLCGIAACSSPEPTGTTNIDANTAVSPARTAVVPGSQNAFSLKTGAGAVVNATWSVNGIAGGNSSVGTIAPSGLYTAPTTMPPGDSVLIAARSVTDGTRTFTSRVFFVPALAPATDYVIQSPRVVDMGTTETVRLLVVLGAGSTIKSITTTASAANGTLVDLGSGVHLLEMSGGAATTGYTAGSLHNSLGSLVYKDASGATVVSTGLAVNVRDATAPNVALTTLAPDAQRSRNVLNIRVDAPVFGTLTTAPVVRAMALLGDRFDQVAVVSNVRTTSNRYHVVVRNSVQGIGLSIMDNGSSWGSASKLLGVNYFPIDNYYDAGEAGFNHEFGHQWVNFSSVTAFGPGVPHWPESDNANYLMGFSIGGTGGQGGQFPYGLTAVGGGQYRVDEKPVTGTYGPWDLYLMGLLPADSVPAALIFPATWSTGQTITPTAFTIAQYTAAHGARVPSSAGTARTFTVATVVLSSGRLLSPTEMAFFDANAARAESASSLPSSIGFARGTAIPFRLATGGRATLVVRVD